MRIFIRIIALVTTAMCACMVHAQTFPLAAQYFVPAKMPMHLVYPRPDNETQEHARHRWAYPGITYEIPIGVQGGAWPFKYEVIQGPEGASIGALHGDDDYGVVNWPAPPTSGSFDFTVRITDQELNTVDATWTVTVDADQFVFIQDGWTGDKVGTVDKPLEDISDWYKGDRADASYHNKIIVFRGGNYKLEGSPVNNGNIRLDAASKTPSLIAYPGETPVIDSSTSKVFTDTGSLKDLFVAGIRWENGRQDVNNAHFFWAVGDVSRATWWRNHWHNLGPGTVGNDNTAPVFVSNNSKIKENILYKENIHTDIQNYGLNGGYFEAYWTRYLLIEQNVARDSAVASGWFAKGTISHVTIRANEAIDNIQGTQLQIGYGAEAGQVPHNHEICWNRIAFASPDIPGGGTLWASSNFYQGQTYNSFYYRNTIVNKGANLRFVGAELFEVDANVIVKQNSAKFNTDNMSIVLPNLVKLPTDGVTDATGRLVGEYRDSHLGLVGFEVYGTAAEPTVPPKPPSNFTVE